MAESDEYYEVVSRSKKPRRMQILTIGLTVSIILAAGGWVLYFTAKGDDRKKVVDASGELLTEVMKKLATVSNDTAAKKNLTIFLSVRNLFSALSNLRSIVQQSNLFCTNLSSIGLFLDPRIPTSVSRNYTASCNQYRVLDPLVDPSFGVDSPIEAFMAAVSSVVTALMKLDNAIVADP